MFEFKKLLRTKSMMRYFPPNGTAGLLRTSVRGRRRSPLPPAMIIPRTRCGFILSLALSSLGGLGTPSDHTNYEVAPQLGVPLDDRAVRLTSVEIADVYRAPGEFPSTFHPVDRRRCSHWFAQERDGGWFLMIIWPLLCGVLVFALMSATGHAAEEGAGGERAKEPARTVKQKKKQDSDEPKKKQDTDEPKKKQDTDTKIDNNGKPGADKSANEEKGKAADEKAKDEKAKSEEKAKPADEKPKAEEPKPEEPAKKAVTSLNLAIKFALMADPQLFPLDIEVEIDKGKAILI